MAESCSSFPTLTSTQEVKTQTVFTTVSTVTSTIPGSTFSVTKTASCGSSSCSPTVVQTESPDRTVTTEVPVTITSQVNTFVVSTFWGTGCKTSSTHSPSPTPTPTSTSSPSQTPDPTTTSPNTTGTLTSSTSMTSGSLSSQSAIEITSVSVTTLPNGIVSSRTIIITTTPTVLSPAITTIASSSGQNEKSKLGPIVGGVIGSVMGLGVLALMLWYFLKRQRGTDKKFNIVFEKVAQPSKGYQRFDDQDSRQPLGKEMQSMQSPSHSPWHQDWNSDQQADPFSLDQAPSPLAAPLPPYQSAQTDHHYPPSWSQVNPSQQHLNFNSTHQQ